MARVHLRIGDIVAVRTPKGLGYVQYVERVAPYGALIRVLPGLFRSDQADLQALADQVERFWVFIPLAAAVNRGALRIAGSASVPMHARSRPLMKNPSAARSWEAATWWLWDGERTWPVGRDDPRLPAASPLETWNDTMLIERIANGYKPSDDLHPPDATG